MYVIRIDGFWNNSALHGLLVGTEYFFNRETREHYYLPCVSSDFENSLPRLYTTPYKARDTIRKFYQTVPEFISSHEIKFTILHLDLHFDFGFKPTYNLKYPKGQLTKFYIDTMNDLDYNFYDEV